MREVFFIETNRAGNGTAAMRVAKRMGYYAHFITSDPEQYCWMTDSPISMADEVSVIRPLSTAKLIGLAERRRPFSVVAFDDDNAIVAARIAESLGLLHAVRSGPLINVRFKNMMRAILQGSGHTVTYNEIVSKTDIESIEEFPCVIKPVDGSGSLGVRICYSRKALCEAWESIASLNNGVPSQVLVEDYVDSPQYSAEMFWDENCGRWRLIGCTRTYSSDGTVPVSVGLVYPSLPEGISRQEIEEQVAHCLSLFGLKNTLVHVELRTRNGVALILDINPRPAGSRIRKLIELVHGQDILSEFYLRIHLGMTVHEHNEFDGPTQVAGISYVLPVAGRVISGVKLPTEWGDRHIVEGGSLGVFPIDIPAYPNADHRVAYVIALAKSEGDLLRSLSSAISQIYSY